MKSFMEEIAARMGTINLADPSLVQPDSAIEKGDVVIPGEISDEAKRLYHVHSQLGAEHNTLVEKLRVAQSKHSEEAIPAIRQDIVTLRNLIECVQVLFWGEAKRSAKADKEGNIALRKGWLLVFTPEKKEVHSAEITIIGFGRPLSLFDLLDDEPRGESVFGDLFQGPFFRRRG